MKKSLRFVCLALALALVMAFAPAMAETEEPVVLDCFCMSGLSGVTTGIWDDWCSYKLLEDLNIQINFWAPMDSSTQIASYIAGDALPDLVIFNNLTFAQQAIDAGQLVNLLEYKDQVPSIFDEELFANAVKYFTNYNSDGTGNAMYLVPSQVGKSAFNSYNWAPQIMWGAYRDAGYPELNTLEDYLDAFVAMTEVKPVNETGEKIYPISTQATAGYIYMWDYMYGYSVINNCMEINCETNEIYKLLDEENSFYKRSLKFMYELNQAGLVDPDCLTQSWNDVNGKIADGRVMFVPYTWWTGGYNTSARANDAENPDGLFAVMAADMKIYDHPDNTTGRGANFYAISTTSIDNNRLDKALALLNWLYDLDVHQYIQMGPEGLLWSMVDGEPVINEEYIDVVTGSEEVPLPGGGTLANARARFNTIGQTDGVINPYTGQPIGYWHWHSYLNKDMTLVKQEVAEYYGTGTAVLADYLIANDMVASPSQAVNMMPAIPDDLTLSVNKIKETIDTMSWQAIMASDEDEFEAIWAKMVSDCDGMGYDEVAEWYTTQWDACVEIAKEYE